MILRSPVLKTIHAWGWVRPAGNNDFRITQRFSLGTHDGLDISDGLCGSTVVAAAAGTVEFSEVVGSGVDAGDRHIGINHGGGWFTTYAHLSTRLVSAGATVTKGQKIGTIGQTGNASGCHLHFGVKSGATSGVNLFSSSNGTWRDPWPLLEQNNPTTDPGNALPPAQPGPETSTILVTSSAARARVDSETPPRIAGALTVLGAAYYNHIYYSAWLKATLQASDWTNVDEVVTAELWLYTPPGASGYFPFAAPASGPTVLTRLAEAFHDNSLTDFNTKYTGAGGTPAKASADTPAVTKTSFTTTASGVTKYDIMPLLRAWAPTSIKFRIGSTTQKGLARTNHGVWLEREPGSGSTPQMVVASELFGDTSLRPKLVLTYVPKATPSYVNLVGPVSPITQAENEFFEGELVRSVSTEKLIRTQLQLYLSTVSSGLYTDTGGAALWNKTLGATPSEVEIGAFSIPLTTVISASLPSGITAGSYKWRARVETSKGWTPWTAAATLVVSADNPTLSDLHPVGSYNVLTGVRFSAIFNAVNLVLNSQAAPIGVRRIVSSRIQVREVTAPGDPLWDSGPFFWDTSNRAATSDERITTFSYTGGAISGGTSTISTLYSGVRLAAGDYSYRVMATDEIGAQTSWYYGTFTVLVGEEPDPGSTPNNTGYARRQVKSRIVIRGITHNDQRIIVKATSGNWKVTFSGDVTGDLAYNISAAALKTALEALPSIGALFSVTVDTSVAGQRTYTIKFRDNSVIDEANTPVIALTDVSLAGSGHLLQIKSYSDRGPNKIVAVIDDASNIGVSEYYNSAGELYFTLPITHPQLPQIEPWQVHWAYEEYRGEGWKEITAGLITDFDASDNDMVFYGVDYLGVLGMTPDERINANIETPAQLYPLTTSGGTKYVNNTITEIVKDQLDRAIHSRMNPVSFISRGAIANMNEEVTIFTTFRNRLDFISGLIDSHKGANPGLRTRLRVRKTIAGGYEFTVEDNPGLDRDNFALEYGALIQGFRIIAFGDFGTRVVATGFPPDGTLPRYARDIVGTADENVYGRFAKPRLWQNIFDTNDLKRRALLYAREISKVGKRVALGLRVDSIHVKDGWDLTDSLKVKIDRGPIDTTRYGSGYWTVWGWAFQIFPDGRTDLTMSVLPRLDTTAALTDLLPSQPINITKEWDVQALGGGAPSPFAVETFLDDWDDGTSTSSGTSATVGIPANAILDVDTGIVWVPEVDVNGNLTGNYVQSTQLGLTNAHAKAVGYPYFGGGDDDAGEPFLPGIPGLAGAAGAPGAAGATGPAGPAGVVGLPGEDGEPGEDSLIPGPQGPAGAAGAAGATGAAGPAGLQGTPGAAFYPDNEDSPEPPQFVGPAGSTGATGAAGSAGASGPAGVQGVPGAAFILSDEDAPEPPQFVGATGTAGGAGAQGVQGVPGAAFYPDDEDQPEPIQIAGARGATGPQGTQGVPGSAFYPDAEDSPEPPQFVGPAGTAGAQGVPGTTGAQGSQGVPGAAFYPDDEDQPEPIQIAGARGATGSTGQQGVPGAAFYPDDEDRPEPPQFVGPTGPAGATGGAGTPGTTGPTGAQGVPGAAFYPDDEDSTEGPAFQGPRGSTGATGGAGPQGVPGAAFYPDDEDSPEPPQFVGPTGAAGATGAPGGAGSTGPAGPQGAPGSAFYPEPEDSPEPPQFVGPTGAVGPTGGTGVPGGTGPAGAQGVPGAAFYPDDEDSAEGPAFQGPRGSTGATGGAGPQGIPGAAFYPDDEDRPDPPQFVGPTGATGLQGSAGAQGPAGLPGSAIGGAYMSPDEDAPEPAIMIQTPRGPAIIDVFETPGNTSWRKPSGCVLVEVYCVGAGASGGSGRRGAAASLRMGGGGGGGGGLSIRAFDPRDLLNTELLTVGTGGTSTPAIAVDSTNGLAGNNGGASFFGNTVAGDGSNAKVGASGGRAGAGGQITTPVLGGQAGMGNIASRADWNGASIGNSSGGVSEDAATPTATPTLYSNGGGGGGGAIAVANTARPPTAGAASVNRGSSVVGGTAGTSGVSGTGGGSPTAETTRVRYGIGGGGGGSGTGGVGGAGGTGSVPGGGGGGGGASTNSNNSGASGAGGNGAVYIISYF